MSTMKHITKTERQEIFLLKEKGYSLRKIAKALNRDPSTISRELKRNSTRNGYIPESAQQKSYARWKYRKPNLKKIRESSGMEDFIRRKIRSGWSPEQVAGVWNNSQLPKISPLTIYKYVYSSFGCDLSPYLYSKRWHPKKRKPKAERALIPNRVWIDERPEEAGKRGRAGDYEGDLIVSKKKDKTVILTMICRASRLLLATKLPDKKPQTVIDAMQKLLSGRTLETVTLDNGAEFQKHEELPCPTYFCHPYSSWEKGQIEYANRLIRRFFPKKSRLAKIKPKRLKKVIKHLNNLPRKCLNWKTPYEVFNSFVKIPKSVAINP